MTELITNSIPQIFSANKFHTKQLKLKTIDSLRIYGFMFQQKQIEDKESHPR